MNPFLMSAQQRLVHWKQFRLSLAEKSEADQLQAVADYWAQAPIMTMAYDPEKLDELPTPWEMVQDNDWCQNSVAIGMEFTLRLSGWDASRLKLKMMRDYDISIQQLVLEIDGTHLINYDYRSVTPTPSTRFDILQTWQFMGRHYSEISN